jgi:ATP adenylyltransferase
VIARSQHIFSLLNIYPYSNGHVMVAPYRHVRQLEALTVPEWTDMFRLTQRLLGRLRQTLHPEGFNLGMNLGRSAGAGVPGHVHLHIVPRWSGDVNFMPILAQTKVLSQSLDELYSLLKIPR